jgi:hypothetical protein
LAARLPYLLLIAYHIGMEQRKMPPAFILRNVPPEVHDRWRDAAALLGCTMTEFCYAALTRACGDVEKRNARRTSQTVPQY